MLATLNRERRGGGAQAVMMDTLWAGRIQKIANANGVPEGMKQVLEELGVNTGTILLNHGNFRTEKTIEENIRIGRRHRIHFIPKFHCEMNPLTVFGDKPSDRRIFTRT